MKIVHFSDPHAGGPAEDWMAYIDKRWVGVFNYTFRRRFRHDFGKLKLAVDYIMDTRPDVIVCSGDITSTGQPGEFKKAIDVLSPLRDSGIPFFFTPGNHDCYVKRPKCVKAVNDAVDYLSRGNYSFSQFPVVIGTGKAEFMMLNTSRPANLLLSSGYVSHEDSARVETWCSLPHDVPRILITHYPMYERHPLLRARHRLYGQRRIVELMKSGDIDLVLCGHVHRPRLDVDETGRGECCAGSVTLNGSMTEIDYDENESRFTFKAISL